MNFLHSKDLSVIESSMQGVLGLKSYIPASASLQNLTTRLRRKFYMEDPNIEIRELTAEEIWAYDATWVLAEAVERARISQTSQENIELDLVDDLNNIRSSKHGVMLLRQILESRFKDLSGETQYINGKLNSCAFEMDLKTLIWPGESTTIVRGSKLQSDEIKALRVGVPATSGFKDLVDVHYDYLTKRPTVTGFCIDVFKAAISGFVVWVIEHPINQEFQGSPSQQIGTVLWFSFSTIVFAHTSMMTVKQIQYNPEANYIGFHGVLAPGTIENYVKSKGCRTYNSVEEFNDALSRGSKNGGATAVIDEIPYIKSFLAKYSASYSMIKPKPIYQWFWLCFARNWLKTCQLELNTERRKNAFSNGKGLVS
ncbi:PREDICTED: glutamate receptor 2.9-like [Prunus mume]|uniref:Glutamate receptor 2.9-like n=1 Tax=Prunus mume TaxID=102107 RepID=A0ABM1LQN0_PRUMU|nr:PREDICTED: glutamate receptor 2.9-like [Prunus mume]